MKVKIDSNNMMYGEHLVGKIYDVIGSGRGDYLIQLTSQDNDIQGHNGYNRQLDDGRKTVNLNLKNVRWIREEHCTIVSDYPKYMISTDSYVLVVKFTDDLTGTVEFCDYSDFYTKGERSDCWAMSRFRKLTPEEHKKYIKKGENEMKYSLIATLTAEKIQKFACRGEFEIFVEKFGFYNSVEWNEENEKYIIEQDEWIKFLLDNDYIKENKEKIEYDEEKLYFCMIDGNWCKLHLSKNKIIDLGLLHL